MTSIVRVAREISRLVALPAELPERAAASGWQHVDTTNTCGQDVSLDYPASLWMGQSGTTCRQRWYRSTGEGRARRRRTVTGEDYKARRRKSGTARGPCLVPGDLLVRRNNLYPSAVFICGQQLQKLMCTERIGN